MFCRTSRSAKMTIHIGHTAPGDSFYVADLGESLFVASTAFAARASQIAVIILG